MLFDPIIFGLAVLFLVQTANAEDIVTIDKEIVRNGDFADSLYTAWHEYWCDVHALARRGDEGNGLRMMDLSNNDDHYAFQLLTLPTEVTSARISFDYRAEADVGIGVERSGPIPTGISTSIAIWPGSLTAPNWLSSVTTTSGSPSSRPTSMP